MKERQVDLPQLFSDVSRTVSGIRTMLGTGQSVDEGEGNITDSPMGGVCFKACGMEDIQYAARAGGDLLHSARVCLLVCTTVSLLCVILLTGVVVYSVCTRVPRPSSSSSPSLVHTLFPPPPSKTNAS